MSIFSGSTAAEVATFVAQKLTEDKWKNRFRELSNDNFNSELPRDTANGFALKSVILEMGIPQEFTLSIEDLQDYFQWRKFARVTKVETMTTRLIELFNLCGWSAHESFVTEENNEDEELLTTHHDFEDSMGMTLILDCDEGEADISFRDGHRFHIERGEELDYTPNIDPAKIRTVVSDGDMDMLNRLVVDTDDDYTFYSFYLGSGIKSEKELSRRVDFFWGKIGQILNMLDPGTFNSPYLFEVAGMKTEMIEPCNECGENSLLCEC